MSKRSFESISQNEDREHVLAINWIHGGELQTIRRLFSTKALALAAQKKLVATHKTDISTLVRPLSESELLSTYYPKRSANPWHKKVIDDCGSLSKGVEVHFRCERKNYENEKSAPLTPDPMLFHEMNIENAMNQITKALEEINEKNPVWHIHVLKDMGRLVTDEVAEKMICVQDALDTIKKIYK